MWYDFAMLQKKQKRSAPQTRYWVSGSNSATTSADGSPARLLTIFFAT